MPDDETTLGAAFKDAGYEHPKDRLERMMTEAISANARSTDAAIDAFIQALLAAADAKTLMWELVAEVRMSAIKRLFTNMQYRMQKDAGAFAAADEQRPATSSGGGKGGQSEAETLHGRAASPPPGKAPPARSSVKPRAELPAAPHSPPRGRGPSMAAVEAAGTAYQSWLDKQYLNGKPIGDVTLDEALGAKVRELCLAKYIELLTAQIPRGSKKRIRDYITPEEADRYFRMAHQEEAA